MEGLTLRTILMATTLAVAAGCAAKDSPPSAPACAKPYMGQWTLTESGKAASKAGAACDPLQAQYVSTGSLNASATVWTETDNETGESVDYTAAFEEVISGKCSMTLKTSQRKDRVAVAASRVLLRTTETPELSGLTTVQVFLDNAVSCEVMYRAKAVPVE